MKDFKEQYPTIKISPYFKAWLDEKGNKGDTYEDILKRLIPLYYQEHKRELTLLTKQKKDKSYVNEMRTLDIKK